MLIFKDSDFIEIIKSKEQKEFIMGSPKSEKYRSNDEVIHKVILTKPFQMQKTQVTQFQWKSIMGSNPSYFKDDDHPIEGVSWNDCQIFIEKLNTSDDKYQYRLPTEAEWEYCCKADNQDYEYLKKFGWYFDNSENKTHPVMQLMPNKFGLYDMLGNVWEWCSDWYDDYPENSVTNPQGSKAGSNRVIRGGGWNNYAWYLRSAQRSHAGPGYRYDSLGFRLVRTLHSDLLLFKTWSKKSDINKLIRQVRAKLTKIERLLAEK